MEQYRKYASLMEHSSSERFRDAITLSKRIIQELFPELSLADLGTCDAIELLATSAQIHRIMQDIIGEKLLKIVEVEQVDREESAFDEYDLENGYEDEPENTNPWRLCQEIVDRIVKIAIRLLNNSYSQCMKEDIISLVDYLKFELDTINE